MFLQQLINGLTIGSTYALVAIGFSMVFGVIKLTNFANGSLYMLGAYLSLMLYLLTGNFVVAFLLSLILTGTAGYCLERFALRYLRKKHAPNLSALITTLGMSMIMDNFVMLFFGSECRLPRYLTKPRQRRSEWDMAGSDGISRVSAVFRGKSLLTNKMRII